MVSVVCFATADWDAPLWTNKQHLMSRLAGSGVPVLYIDSLGLRAPGLGKRDVSRMVTRALGWRPYAAPLGDDLFHDRPLVVPFHGIPFVQQVNAQLMSSRFRRNRRRLRAEGAAVWTFNPGVAPFLDGHEGPLVYHCVDRLAAYPGIDREFIEAGERVMVRTADAVIASSKPLVRHLKAMGATDVLYWPNPADVALFRAVPESAPFRGRPKVGFVGSIQPHAVDLDLVRSMAGTRPDWDFELVGPVGMGHARARIDLDSFPRNVRFTGAVPRQQLPQIMASWAAAIIPYTLNEYMEGVFPMKVYEYLGAGLPVVSTPLPALVGEVDHVRFATEPGDFVSELESVMLTDTPAARATRKAYASSFSWEARLKQAHELLASLGARVGAQPAMPALERAMDA